jgi:hypothetical protein
MISQTVMDYKQQYRVQQYSNIYIRFVILRVVRVKITVFGDDVLRS